MTLKNLDDIQKFQEDCKEEMKEKISKFDEKVEETLADIHETVYGPEDED